MKVSNSFPLFLFYFDDNFSEKTAENIGQQEPIASKHALQLNTLQIYQILISVLTPLDKVFASLQS